MERLTEKHDYKCKFCKYQAHSKVLVEKHIIKEHWEDLADMVKRK